MPLFTGFLAPSQVVDFLAGFLVAINSITSPILGCPGQEVRIKGDRISGL